jgi:hypothetical protein
MCDADGPNKPKKHMKMAQEFSLDDAVLKWYVQRSYGVDVRGVEFKSAANMLANHTKISFKVSHGWFWRFYKQHGPMNTRTHREALSAPKDKREPYRQKWAKMI